MSDDKPKSVEAIRKEVRSVLEILTPAQAKALRSRFGIDKAEPSPHEEERALRALARELARLKKKKQ
jgi:DNA-directed RNA polymerase sigma subunit (sigma70/sigma32)